MAIKNPKLPEIELELPYVDITHSGKFIMRLGKDDIKAIVTPLLNFLKNYEVKGVGKSNNGVVDLVNKLSQSSHFHKAYKEELVQVYLSFCSDINNLFKIIDIDPKLKAAWRRIAIAPEIESSDINKALGRKMVVMYSTWNSYTDYCEPFFYPLIFISVSNPFYFYNRDHDTTFIFTLYTSTREIMLKSLYGEDILKPVVINDLPKNDNLVIENFESSISADLTYLTGLSLTDSVGLNGSISAARLKNLKKNFNTPEFSYNSKELPLDRIELLANTFPSFYLIEHNKKQDKPKTTSPGEFAKFIVSKLPQLIVTSLFASFLPTLKSFTKSWAERTNVGAVVNIVNNLIRNGENGWLSLENLQLRYLCTKPPGAGNYRYLHIFHSDSRNRNTLKRKRDENIPLNRKKDDIDWFNEVDFPFIVNWIKFLCAAGLVEIAFEKGWENLKIDVLEGMRYLRFTKLGRYAFGIDNDYRAPAVESDKSLEIDDKNRIITVLTDNCPFTMFLQQISLPVTSKRFLITPESIIKGCDEIEKVNMRLDNLESIVDMDKHPGLKSVVEEVDKRLSCIEKFPNDYVIFKIKENLPGLVKLFTTESEIRDNVILAEKGLFLVKASFVIRFKAICKINGYLF